MADSKDNKKQVIFPVEAGHILMFARSIGDENPLYGAIGGEASDHIVAPPTFVQASAQYTPGYPLRPVIGEPWFGSGKTPSGRKPTYGQEKQDSGEEEKRSEGSNAGMLHAEQHYTYHRPLRPGDVLHATVREGEKWERDSQRAGKLFFSDAITEYRDQNGELVVTARAVGVRTEKVIKS